MSLAYLRYDPDNLTGFPAPEKCRANILYCAKTLYTAPQDALLCPDILLRVLAGSGPNPYQS